MAADPLQELLELLRRQEGTPVPTSTLGRLRRTVGAGARVGLGALAARLRGGEGGLGALSPAALQRLVASLGELKGVAMKAGQLLSYVDGSLTPEARELLAVLQRHAQPTPFAEVERTVREDLGERAPALLARLEREPAATASIGQVHRAVLPDGTPVAVKVRHPGIAEAIRADFRTAAAGRLIAAAVAPGVDLPGLLDEAEARFLEECDYGREAQAQARFGALFAGHPRVRIPPVHGAFCGPRVLVTGWAEGAGFEDFVRSAGVEARTRAARGLYEFYVGALYRHGVFNADPHPGNLLLAPGGELTVLDHGCVREFEPAQVRALVALSRAVREDRREGIEAALRALGAPRPERGFEATRRLLRGFYAPLLVPGPQVVAADGPVALGETVQRKREVLDLQLPGSLLFLFRIRFGLHAELARLGVAVDWAALEDELTAGVR